MRVHSISDGLVNNLHSDHLSSFLEALPPGSVYDLAQLNSALNAFLCVASNTYSHLLTNRTGSFVRHVAVRIPGKNPAQVELGRLCAADLLLAHCCAEGDDRALTEFDVTYLPLVQAAARKLGMAELECEELQQQIRCKLLVADRGSPRIASYAGTGPLRSWIYAAALRTGLNELRRMGRAPIPVDDEQLLIALPDQGDDQELVHMKSLYRGTFKEAFRAAMQDLDVRLANTLRHYYQDQMTLEEIGALYKVHKTTVLRWLNKAHAQLESSIKQQIAGQLQLKPTEVESVLRLIQSGIQLGLTSVLDEKDR